MKGCLTTMTDKDKPNLKLWASSTCMHIHSLQKTARTMRPFEIPIIFSNSAQTINVTFSGNWVMNFISNRLFEFKLRREKKTRKQTRWSILHYISLTFRFWRSTLVCTWQNYGQNEVYTFFSLAKLSEHISKFFAPLLLTPSSNFRSGGSGPAHSGAVLLQ
jgi:hypothetical protein